eukprot:1161503-Pelagomonas_calceolata.AAC.12
MSGKAQLNQRSDGVVIIDTACAESGNGTACWSAAVVGWEISTTCQTKEKEIPKNKKQICPRLNFLPEAS